MSSSYHMRNFLSVLLVSLPLFVCSCLSDNLSSQALKQGKNAIQSSPSTDGIQKQSSTSNKDAILRIPKGTLTGVQEGYDMRNKKGERVQIHGNFISIPAVDHTFNLVPEGAMVILEARDAEASIYRYAATYENANFSSEGRVEFDIKCESGSQMKSPAFRLQEQGPGEFKVEHLGDGSPAFIVRMSASETSNAAPQSASFDNNYKGKSSILPGKTNVNIRMSPSNGDILRTVDGGVSFSIDEVLELAEPVHLTRERAMLVRVDGEKSLLKEANHKLELIKDGGRFYIAIVMDDAGDPTEVIVPKDIVRREQNAWYRSEELGGWVFSGLCTERSY